jgi:hypothetical protein
MAWRDVLRLLEFAGGDESLIDPERLKAASSKGKGPPDVQMRIARHLYKNKYRKEADDGQTRWEFG